MTDRLPMEINVRESGGVSVLEVHGRLTIGEPAELLHDALESVVKGGAKKVVVLLNGIPQIDSSGISTLVRISIKLAREGGMLRLVCGQGRVRDALTVTRLVEAIPTFESESAALANFAYTYGIVAKFRLCSFRCSCRFSMVSKFASNRSSCESATNTTPSAPFRISFRLAS